MSNRYPTIYTFNWIGTYWVYNWKQNSSLNKFNSKIHILVNLKFIVNVISFLLLYIFSYVGGEIKSLASSIVAPRLHYRQTEIIFRVVHGAIYIFLWVHYSSKCNLKQSIHNKILFPITKFRQCRCSIFYHFAQYVYIFHRWLSVNCFVNGNSN